MNEISLIISSVHRAYDYVDKEIVAQSKVCKKGCDACCYQITWANTWEEISLIEHIHNQIDKKTKSKLKANIKKWFSEFNGSTREASRSAPLIPDEISRVENQFREKRVACPMLINNTCSIYRVRPLACRVHIEPEDSANCIKYPHRITTPEARRIHQAVIKNLYFNPQIYPLMNKPIAYAVAGEIGLKAKSKPFIGIGAGPRR